MSRTAYGAPSGRPRTVASDEDMAAELHDLDADLEAAVQRELDRMADLFGESVARLFVRDGLLLCSLTVGCELDFKRAAGPQEAA